MIGIQRNFTTNISDTIDVAIPSKAKISTFSDWSQMNVYHYTDERYELGIQKAEEGKMGFRSKMRKNVVDIVFYREKVGIEETKEVLTTYLQRKDGNLNRLLKYAKPMKCNKTMWQYAEMLV